MKYFEQNSLRIDAGSVEQDYLIRRRRFASGGKCHNYQDPRRPGSPSNVASSSAQSLPALVHVEIVRGIVWSREVEFPARLGLLDPAKSGPSSSLSSSLSLIPSYVESFLSGFAIGVLKRHTDEALMNLRRDSFARRERSIPFNAAVPSTRLRTRKGRINLEIVASRYETIALNEPVIVFLIV